MTTKLNTAGDFVVAMLLVFLTALMAIPSRSGAQRRCAGALDHFVELTKESYPQERLTGPVRDIALIYGHALGRHAAAVGDDPYRRRTYECLQAQFVESNARALNVPGLTPEIYTAFFKLLLEAAHGFHDDAVEDLTGVGTCTPLPTVYGDEYRPCQRESAIECRLEIYPGESSTWWFYASPETKTAWLVNHNQPKAPPGQSGKGSQHPDTTLEAEKRNVLENYFPVWPYYCKTVHQRISPGGADGPSGAWRIVDAYSPP